MSLSSYREMCDAGIFSSEESSLQYLIDKQIFPDRRRCTICSGWMTLTECSRTKYKDGCAWHCCNKWVSVRVASILHQRRIPYRQSSAENQPHLLQHSILDSASLRWRASTRRFKNALQKRCRRFLNLVGLGRRCRLTKPNLASESTTVGGLFLAAGYSVGWNQILTSAS